VREVEVDGRSGVGAVVSGVIGGIAASVGGGKGSQVAAVLGAVAGGVVGNAVEKAMVRKRDLEITVRLLDGQLITVIQEAGEIFKVGESVRVVLDGGVTRVSY